jgi:hypothetical protein
MAMSKCENKIEVSVMFQTCNHTKHAMASVEAAIGIALENGCVLKNLVHSPHGEDGISEEPFVLLEFMVGKKEDGRKTRERFWQEVGDVFSTSCNCRCQHCVRDRQAKIATVEAIAQASPSKAVH